jgi:protein subunit release factor B
MPQPVPSQHPEGRAHSRVPAHALRFGFARSSGPGGQNVNKRSTKCLLWVELSALALTHAQRERLVGLAGPSLLVGAERAAEVAASEETDLPAPRASAGSAMGVVQAPMPAPDPYAGVQLLLVCDEHRSQERNRDACIERLHELVLRSLVPPKPRKATKPSRSSKQRRLTEKKQQGERKRRRSGADGD